ncbi:MAG: nickel-dependent lactate racemase [Clostridia bacterium]|nr:nickel-dependent lactate racemase [Clostridia bacterium]
MKLEFGYGKGVQSVDVDADRIVAILKPNDVEHGDGGEAEVERALSNPIGSGRVEEIVKPGERIAIITSDITRPMPTYAVMPALLKRLYGAGVRPEDITLVFALGSHRGQSDEERAKLAGQFAASQIRMEDSDPDDCVHMGNTSSGTPIDITRRVAEADRRICLGNIEYHYFAGYSAGIKAIMPGCSTRAAIQSNHSMMVSDDACAGKLEGNPVREDLEEAERLCHVDFILNVVLDEHKKIVKAVAGDVVKAHREGCAFLDKLYSTPIPHRADIVIVSQGGAPKDLNLYQTQKALDNAKHAVKDGGIIILAGACQEGLGERVFEQWLTSSETSKSMIERIRKDFQLGGHKAAAIAMVLEHADVYLVSEMEPEFVKSIFMQPFASIDEAFAAATKKLGSDSSVIAMPYGGSTLPQIGR